MDDSILKEDDGNRDKILKGRKYYPDLKCIENRNNRYRLLSCPFVYDNTNKIFTKQSSKNTFSILKDRKSRL